MHEYMSLDKQKRYKELMAEGLRRAYFVIGGER